MTKTKTKTTPDKPKPLSSDRGRLNPTQKGKRAEQTFNLSLTLAQAELLVEIYSSALRILDAFAKKGKWK